MSDVWVCGFIGNPLDLVIPSTMLLFPVPSSPSKVKIINSTTLLVVIVVVGFYSVSLAFTLVESSVLLYAQRNGVFDEVVSVDSRCLLCCSGSKHNW